MAELVPTRIVIETEFGIYEVPAPIAAKVEKYPRRRYWNVYSDNFVEMVDHNYPPLARYIRRVTEHMKREWLR